MENKKITFFAVTQSGSLYLVSEEKPDSEPLVLKIALRGKSRVGVGGRLENGQFIGITRLGIVLYNKEEDNSLKMILFNDCCKIFCGGNL